MTRALAALCVVAGCGAPTAPTAGGTTVPRLASPPPIDLAVPGAGYLTSVAVQLQPGWGQFLDDCRLRLPATDPLNRMGLSAVAALAIDAGGRVTEAKLERPSGNAGFDRAVRDAISDATALGLPAPPSELLSDDERVHVDWLFARDRRQAGPATARVEMIHEPVAEVVDRLLAAGELVRAARRIQAEAATGGDAERVAAGERVMIAALADAARSDDSAARRAAIAAIGRAHVTALAAAARAAAADPNDDELRLAATRTLAQLADRDAVPLIAAHLAADLADRALDPDVAVTEASALVALGARDRAAAAVDAALVADAPPEAALRAFSAAPVRARAPALAGWFAHGAPRTRAAVCGALGAIANAATRAPVLRGVSDPDASVRAACVDAAAASHDPALVRAIEPTLRDHDSEVRSHAVAAVAADTFAARRAALVDDPATEVRIALARRLGTLGDAADAADAAELGALARDRDADVRAAALAAVTARPALSPVDRELAAHAASDSAAQVRREVAPALADDLLARLAIDDAPEVRFAAERELAHRHGRAATLATALDRLVAAPPRSAERARIALAWLLAT